MEVELNRTAAVGFASGPDAGLALLGDRCWVTAPSRVTSRCTLHAPNYCVAQATSRQRHAPTSGRSGSAPMRSNAPSSNGACTR